MIECECQGPGWCERHKVQKNKTWVALCQERGAYFQAWEAGVGLGQNPPGQASRQRGKEGLGDRTEKLLRSIGVTPERYVEAKRLFGLAPTCGCAKRKEWLNKVGQWLSGE